MIFLFIMPKGCKLPTFPAFLSWSLPQWDKAGQKLYTSKQERGYNRLKFLEINSTNGQVRSLHEEKSPTYVDLDLTHVEIIKEKNLNRVVVAACTPKTHEPLFQETLINVGLNKYLFEMANIRDQNTWVHRDQPEQALVKAQDQLRMAIARVATRRPLTDQLLAVSRDILVVGGNGMYDFGRLPELFSQLGPYHRMRALNLVVNGFPDIV